MMFLGALLSDTRLFWAPDLVWGDVRQVAWAVREFVGGLCAFDSLQAPDWQALRRSNRR